MERLGGDDEGQSIPQVDLEWFVDRIDTPRELTLGRADCCPWEVLGDYLVIATLHLEGDPRLLVFTLPKMKQFFEEVKAATEDRDEVFDRLYYEEDFFDEET